MNNLSCEQIQEKVGLYATGECDPEEAREVERHLAGCPTCPTTLEETRDMLSLLDLHMRAPVRIARLKARLDEEPSRPRLLHTPSVHRSVLALAAMLLAMFGLALSLGVFSSPESADHQLLASLEPPGRIERGAFPPARVGAMKEAKTGPFQLQAPASRFVPGDPLPPPPEVDITLSIQNTGPNTMRLLVAGPHVQIRLLLSGPRVERRSAPPETPEPNAFVDLQPGETYRKVIPRLEDGPPEARRFWYWTRPGNYTLLASMTTAVSPPPTGSRGVLVNGREFGLINVRSSPLAIHVFER